jgi:hypothetical protein
MSVIDGAHLLKHTHIDIMINETTIHTLYEGIYVREFLPILYLF